MDEDYFGLIPAGLNYYDENFKPSRLEKNYVQQQSKLSSQPKILFILLYPDEFDFSCTVIVVGIFCQGENIIWNRFGLDVTSFLLILT